MTVYANVGHILLKRGNTVQSQGYTGPLGELTYDTDLKTLRVHDGSTVGGNIILINSNSVSSLSSTGNLCLTANTAGVSQQWTLGANGVLTFPDSTVQPTAWTGSVSSLVNGASNVSISTANGVPTITRAPYISGPQSFPAQTWTFGAGPIGTALGVPGYIQGTSQTGFVSADNWGLAIDSGNTPASISLGQQDGNNNVTKFFWGSGSKNGIAGDVEIQTINSSGTPTSIILSPQGGQNGSFIFGGTGNLSVPGSILFTSSPAGVISGASSINTGILYATGNITGGNILSNNYLYANGASILTGLGGSTYSNTNVAAYLSTYTGNVSSGNLTVNSRSIKPTYTVQYLALGAGGGGGSGGGYYPGSGSDIYNSYGAAGGAGGVVIGSTIFTSGLTYTITVGAGGAGGSNGNPGQVGNPTSITEPTTFANVYALGGGLGGGFSSKNGGNGANPGAGLGGFAGFNAPANGSAGSALTLINGFGQTYTETHNNPVIPIGNVSVTTGVGGSSSAMSTAGYSDFSVKYSTPGGTGGSGVVYITYCSPTQLGTGGTVWSYTQNGYTYWMHQFTSSGTYVA